MAASVRWQEWTCFVLGLWLAVSPWLVGYADNAPATSNAAFVGLAVALASHFEASFDQVAGEWLNLAAGLWLLAAPFMLGFSAAPLATANCLTVGACITGLAASALGLDKEISKLWHSSS